MTCVVSLLESYCLAFHGLCDAYFGSEVLLKCSGASKYCSPWSLSLDASHMSHPPDARSVPTDEERTSSRGGGGERNAIHHPRAVMPGPPSFCHLEAISRAVRPPWSLSVSRGANLCILSLPCIRSSSWPWLLSLAPTFSHEESRLASSVACCPPERRPLGLRRRRISDLLVLGTSVPRVRDVLEGGTAWSHMPPLETR